MAGGATRATDKIPASRSHLIDRLVVSLERFTWSAMTDRDASTSRVRRSIKDTIPVSTCRCEGAPLRQISSTAHVGTARNGPPKELWFFMVGRIDLRNESRNMVVSRGSTMVLSRKPVVVVLLWQLLVDGREPVDRL
jgi:hypothetical protein